MNIIAMRSRYLKHIFLAGIVLLLSMAISPSIPNQSKHQRSIAIYPVASVDIVPNTNPILINEYADLVGHYDGDGSPENPWIIQDFIVNITDGTPLYGIAIANTTDFGLPCHIVIQNCTFLNNMSIPAISIVNSMNVTIRNCTMRNVHTGINIYASQYCNITSTIIDAIHCLWAQSSSTLRIADNSLISRTDNGICLYFDTVNMTDIETNDIDVSSTGIWFQPSFLFPSHGFSVCNNNLYTQSQFSKVGLRVTWLTNLTIAHNKFTNLSISADHIENALIYYNAFHWRGEKPYFIFTELTNCTFDNGTHGNFWDHLRLLYFEASNIFPEDGIWSTPYTASEYEGSYTDDYPLIYSPYNSPFHFTTTSPNPIVLNIGDDTDIEIRLTDSDDSSFCYQFISTLGGTGYGSITQSYFSIQQVANMAGNFNITIDIGDAGGAHQRVVFNITVFNEAPTITPENVTPSFIAGVPTSFTIQWTLEDPHMSSFATYTIFQNGTAIDDYIAIAWSTDTIVTYNVTAYTTGVYNFTIIAHDGYYVYNQSTIILTVYAPVTPPFDPTIVIITGVSIAAVIGIVVALRKRSLRNLCKLNPSDPRCVKLIKK